MNLLHSVAAVTVALASGMAHGQGMTPVIYPAKGQSAQQQDQDKYQCYAWAREQSGFDPLQAAPPTAATPAAAPPSACWAARSCRP